MIRYVRHAEIDKAAWDLGLKKCANKLWYGLSSTLDAASPGWDALIDEENGSQLALPWKKKFGVAYLYQPFLIQQLGPFSPKPSPEDTARFVNAIPDRFRFADIYLCKGVASSAQLTEQQNITIDLRDPVDAIRKRYSENHRRNLRKTDEAAQGWDANIPTQELIDFFRNSDQFARWGIDSFRIAAMERVLGTATERGEGVACGVRLDGALVAGAFFVRWGGRLVFLKGLANARGRDVHAMHFMVDKVISEHAGQELIFDFAGTNDADLARFYLGFGGERSVYLRALMNRLPPILRMLKA